MSQISKDLGSLTLWFRSYIPNLRTDILISHHSQLKTIEDARKIRNKVLSNLELASLPTTTPEERQKLLSFVVCGGGPTGVEFASELYDMINEDVLDYVSVIILTKLFVGIFSHTDSPHRSVCSILNYSAKKPQYRSSSQETTSSIHTARRSPSTPSSDSTDMVSIQSSMLVCVKSAKITSSMLLRARMAKLPNSRFPPVSLCGRLVLVSWTLVDDSLKLRVGRHY